MTSDYLSRFLEDHAAFSASKDLDDRVRAITAVGAMPVDDFAMQLRSLLVEPSDWLLVDAAVQAAFSSENRWAMTIVLECCELAKNPRLEDAVCDSLRQVSTDQWLNGKDWQDTAPVVFLRSAARNGDVGGELAKDLLALIEDAHP